MADVIARREFLKDAGMLTVGLCLGRVASGSTSASSRPTPYGPPTDQIDSWIAIDRAGNVTLYTGICELGTGTHTAVLQIMAEELDIPFERTRIVGPNTDRTPDQFVSSGSRAIAAHAVPIRQAAAEARHVLMLRAAAALKAPVEQLQAKDGVISVAGDPRRTVSYGRLVGGRGFDSEITGSVKPKPPAQYRTVGTSVPRIDLPAKTTGSFTFVQDLKVPGMLHGRVIRPPAHGATVTRIDEHSLAHVPGVVKVVRRADLVGVVCEREEQAIAAAQALEIEWSHWQGLPEMKNLYRTVRATPVYRQGIPRRFPNGVLVRQGDVQAALTQAALRVASTYESPFHLHGSIGPSCAVADVRDDGVTLWSATQTPYGLREAIAKFLGLPNARVHLLFVEGAGCYGQNGADDVVVDAVVLSQAVGRPVRVQWMRPDEMGWESYKTARLSDLQAGLDAAGNIIAWESAAWGFSGYSRPEYHEPRHGGDPGSLVTAQLAGWSKPGLEEGFNGIATEAVPVYSIPNKRVVFNYLGPTSHRQGPIRLRSGSMRGVGAPDNLFAIESFMDELAAAANIDPVAFRLRHLEDERAIAVLRAATERAGWHPRAGLRPASNARIRSGQGVSLWSGRNSAQVASVFEVEVNTDSGKVDVKRVVVAIDCGLIVNPDGVRNQVEGGVIQGISRALMEEVTFDRSRVTSTDWSTYPIIRFEEVPEEIDILLINRPDLPAYGVGEASTKNVWGGIANAVFDATGVRLRRLPLTPANVKPALSAL